METHENDEQAIQSNQKPIEKVEHVFETVELYKMVLTPLLVASIFCFGAGQGIHRTLAS